MTEATIGSAPTLLAGRKPNPVLWCLLSVICIVCLVCGILSAALSGRFSAPSRFEISSSNTELSESSSLSLCVISLDVEPKRLTENRFVFVSAPNVTWQ